MGWKRREDWDPVERAKFDAARAWAADRERALLRFVLIPTSAELGELETCDQHSEPTIDDK